MLKLAQTNYIYNEHEYKTTIQSKRHMCTLYDSIYIVIDRAIRSD